MAEESLGTGIPLREERRRPGLRGRGLLVYEVFHLAPRGHSDEGSGVSALLSGADVTSFPRPRINKLWLTERKITCLEPNT